MSTCLSHLDHDLTADLAAQSDAQPPLRIGIDSVMLSEVQEALASFGERYLERVFTADERAYAQAAPERMTERLAARFAAKEATIKALGWSEAGIDWRDIEVRREASGRPRLALHRRAAALAAPLAAADFALSLSHDPMHACAVVAVLPRETRSA